MASIVKRIDAPTYVIIADDTGVHAFEIPISADQKLEVWERPPNERRLLIESDDYSYSEIPIDREKLKKLLKLS